MSPKKVEQINNPNRFFSSGKCFTIQFEKHSNNKDCGSFHTSAILFDSGKGGNFCSFPETGDLLKDEKEIIEFLYNTKMCKAVNVHPFEIEFYKSGAHSWDEIIPKISRVIFEFLIKKYPVITVVGDEGRTSWKIDTASGRSI